MKSEILCLWNGWEAACSFHIFVHHKLPATLGQALLSDSGNLDILIIRETTTACAHKEQGGVDGDEIKTEEI